MGGNNSLSSGWVLVKKLLKFLQTHLLIKRTFGEKVLCVFQDFMNKKQNKIKIKNTFAHKKDFCGKDVVCF